MSKKFASFLMKINRCHEQ